MLATCGSRLLFKHFDEPLLQNEIAELTGEPRSADDVVIYPVIVSAAGFSEQKSVVPEAPFLQPGFGDFTERFRTG